MLQLNEVYLYIEFGWYNRISVFNAPTETTLPLENVKRNESRNMFVCRAVMSTAYVHNERVNGIDSRCGIRC